MAVALREPQVFLSLNDTLTSGITKSDATQPISSYTGEYFNGSVHKSVIHVNTLSKAIAADAALGFGEKIATFPQGLIMPLYAQLKMTSTCATGLSATAGEVGLGTVIASGANATLGAVGATSENIMEGTTLSNHVAATALVSKKAATPVASFTHGATGGLGILDGTATAAPIYLNIASTWDQTAAESVTFSADVVICWVFLGTDYGSI